ncbi:cadmium-translocating P-type ATPase [Marinomonas piezotolerans]|uniref:Cadmium-translocating P-type ATPase n=1 Tax=Marinomonas piezotolerans TaxID=2213058 RepID=A0A370UDG4_9GAMM|nr:heavy metal translocating P-type ATPase [Marinomonas piezotolerans]RDL45832.1 cadmium-translocating P-type ATPase [Marinomonas piezotolerans]
MTSSCFHCGDAIPSGLSITADIKHQSQSFCCYGCQAIATCIHDADLEKYYEKRQNQRATRPSDDNIGAFELLSDPSNYARYVHSENDAHTMQFAITGITCSACAWLIEKRLSSLEGVNSAFVNVSSQIATVTWKSPLQSPLSIAQTLLAIGYSAQPYLPGEQDLHQRKEKQKAIIRLGVAGVGMMQVMMSSIAMYAGDMDGMDDIYRQLLRWVSFIFATPVALYAGLPFYRGALRDLKNRHFTMDLPVSIGIGLAYVSSTAALITQTGHVYFDSVTMFIFFLLLGRFLETVARSNQSLINTDDALTAITVIRNSESMQIAQRDLALGDTVKVDPGQIFPADGTLKSTLTAVDESSLTGEYNPVIKYLGDNISASTTNIDQTALLEVTQLGQNTKAAAISRITDRALTEKPAIALLADKVAHYFVIAVLVIAAATYFFWAMQGEPEAYWIMVSVLVVTCPCALSLATPTALTTVTNRLKNDGFLITRGHVIEALAKVDHVVFDKTGTLTLGEFTVRNTTLMTDEYSKSDILRLIAGLEQCSNHPIAKAFGNISPFEFSDIKNVTSQGVYGVHKGATYCFGNADFIKSQDIKIPAALVEATNTGLTLYLCRASTLLAKVDLHDQIRPETKEVLERLTGMGIAVSLLTGDTPMSAQSILPTKWFSHYQTSCTPEEKWRWLMNQPSQNMLMVGDGLNDVPALAGATTSLAMGGSSDLAKLHSDAVLLSNHLSGVANAIMAAKRCKRIIKQNLAWAVCYNTTLLPLAVMGWVPPWVAAIGMALSSLIVVINATRLSRN